MFKSGIKSGAKDAVMFNGAQNVSGYFLAIAKVGDSSLRAE